MAREIKQRLFTIPETATVLGCSVSSVWRDIKAGRLEVARIAGRTRVTVESIERLCAAGAPLSEPANRKPPRRLLRAPE